MGRLRFSCWVFTVVNIAVLVLRRDPVDHEHFVAPTALPVIGAFTCAYLASPLTDRDPIQYQIAAVLLLIGVLLWLLGAEPDARHRWTTVAGIATEDVRRALGTRTIGLEWDLVPWQL